jgi:hypothetical protein
MHEAFTLLDELLRGGLVEVEEIRDQGRWLPLWVEFLQPEQMRELVGLTNRDKLQETLEEQAKLSLRNLVLTPLRESLASLPIERALRRLRILAALDAWLDEGRSGTRRDFALFAFGDTKGVSAAEWDWLETGLSLEVVGICRHTPAIWLRAPLALTGESGRVDLRGVPDCIGLSPETIGGASAVEGSIRSWRVLENRTVFERVARAAGDVDGVLWVPGFAPSWWKEGVGRLLDLFPDDALVACDPDPAGVEIALAVGRIWEERKLCWKPWKMDSRTLSGMKRRKPLTTDDRERLLRLQPEVLPEELKGLAAWMLEQGEKGEQEGINFDQ